MPRIAEVLMILTILNPNPIDIHILWLALLRVNGLYPLLELKQGLIVLPEAIIHVAGYTMAITSISSTIVAIIPLFVFVNEVMRFLR